MKKLYLIFFVFLLGTRFAQAQDTTSLEGKMQFIFAQLDRNDISTGFLKERGFPLTSLKPFNGSLTDSNKVDINMLRAAYFSCYETIFLYRKLII